MKKYLLTIFAFASAFAFTACSSEDVAANGGTTEGENLGTSYISIALNTPTETGTITRAQNDIFDDGLAAEFRVRDAVLVLFEKAGSSEAEYKFFGAYDIPVNPALYDPKDDQITSRGVSALKIANLKSNLYALVVANPNGILKVNNGALVFNGNGTDVTVDNTKTFADFTGEYATVLSSTNNMLNNNGMSQDGLLITMCNTPYVKGTKGGSQAATGEMLTLAKIDETKLFSTEAEAKNATDPTAEIFLERAVAKVTLSAAGGQLAGDDIPQDAAHAFTVEGWLLDNTNASTYLVRNVDGATSRFDYFNVGNIPANNKYRFVGYLPFSYDNSAQAAPGTDGMFRYYWAKDPNYDKAGTFNTVQYEEGKSGDVTFLEINATRPQYCFENTFDVAHQIWSETTRVLIKAKFNGGKTFFTINHDDKTLYSAEDLQKFLAGKVIYYMNEMIGADRLALVSGVTINADNWDQYFTISLTEDFNEATQVVTPVAKLTQKGTESIQGYNAGEGTAAQTKARATMAEVFADVRAANTNIQRFNNGICYYQARIKHFGDDLTPWNSTEVSAGGAIAPVSGNTSTIYPGSFPTNERNYLGRYGVVRNNWYDLQVNTVKRIGSPIIPTITPNTPDGNTPDDELDSYLSLRINIMSWAKRTQNIEF